MSPALSAVEVPIPVGTLVRKVRSLDDHVIRDGHIGRVKHVHASSPESSAPGTYGYDIAWDRMPVLFTPHIRLEIVESPPARFDLKQRELTAE